MAEAEREKSKAGGFVGDLLDILETALVTVFVFLLIFSFVLCPVSVDGSSMVPTLYNEDKLLMLRHFVMPSNGSIVVIDDSRGAIFTDDTHTALQETPGLDIVIIKRLIAHAGQQVNIDFENGTVAVDGQQLAESYIADLTTRNDGAFTYPFTVPEGYVFVMGDNRLHSTDSRNPSVGLIPEEQILGKALFRFERDSELCTSWKDAYGLLF